MKRDERILIFQIGSLGDTIIAMPCYREIARRHPGAERYLLTNFPKDGKMVQAEALLKPCGLIEGSVEYPMPLRGIRNILGLFLKLRDLDIDLLYYLSPETRVINLLRHWAFLKLCGVRKIKGMPWSRDLMHSRELVAGELWETEGSRLLRNLDHSRGPGAPDPADRLLDLTEIERAKADSLIAEMGFAERGFIAFSVGGRIPIKDWGDANWSQVLRSLSQSEPELGIVFVGSHDEKARNEGLAACWSGPKVNSCGRLTPRESAAVIERATLFLGHDTGTMHLAAAVDTRALALFCARNPPGIWYSDRPQDHFFYKRPPCFGCELSEAHQCQHELICMTSHSCAEVVSATKAMLTTISVTATAAHNTVV